MMVRLWRLMVLCWAWCPPCLPYDGFIGTQPECDKAHFVPGHNLGGEGFNIVTMERKGAYVIDTETWNLGNGTCRLISNSYMNRERQKVPTAMVDWRTLPQCSLMVSSVLYDSVESLVNDSTSAVSNDWKFGLEIPVHPSATLGIGFGGSHSKQSNFALRKSKQDHYTFVRHSVYCSFYRFRMVTNPPLSREFESAVNSLPSYSYATMPSYQALIDIYGTHYITQVSLGGEIKGITSIKTCEASMNGLTATEVMNCLSVEASASFKQTASIKAMYKHCQDKKKSFGSNQSFSSKFNERSIESAGGVIHGSVLFGESNPSAYNAWLSTLKTTPDVLRYNLRPLHTILPRGHHAIVGLKKEVEKFIKNNAVMKVCSESCKIGHRSSQRDPCACVCNANANIRSNCCPAGRGLATLKVFNLYAHGLYGDVWTKTDGSVEVSYGNQKKRTAIISNNDNPRWFETFEFGPIKISMNNKLQFTVYDSDSYWNSDLLGTCSFDLRRGTVSDSCMLNDGTFFFSYEVECAESLSGNQCEEYTPSPLNPYVAKVFHTRNGMLLGKVRDEAAINESV